MTNEIIRKVAVWLYKKNVAAAQWDKEQDSMKMRFVVQAEDMINELEREGLTISEIDDQTTSKVSKSRQKKGGPDA